MMMCNYPSGNFDGNLTIARITRISSYVIILTSIGFYAKRNVVIVSPHTIIALEKLQPPHASRVYSHITIVEYNFRTRRTSATPYRKRGCWYSRKGEREARKNAYPIGVLFDRYQCFFEFHSRCFIRRACFVTSKITYDVFALDSSYTNGKLINYRDRIEISLGDRRFRSS